MHWYWNFLLEVIRIILDKILREPGKQKDYINLYILKNVYGFEYLMAPFEIANLKLSQYSKGICNVNFEN
ncbi:hypothetical protein [Borrelia miyamotoi]|uniref:hypothetical protein n=1 Tax=Borrelia miyamotoi TaxID=47466 RepID=UPI00087B7CC2|nr:hypothetical protein [Borrelia miyamotoi]AOW96238.1 hypothetical protein AXH25_05000 [Borrelia miyamotoi]WAZ96970.1 hypothetical protein O5405_06745 [Borrelia miyamotoi]WAZ98284.1 hypothetical protein O5401_06695 [Borrelia miyamotoi]